MKKNPFIILTICLAGAGVLHGQSSMRSAEDYLSRMDVTFQSGLADAEKKDLAPRERLQKSYLKNLAALDRKLQDTGKLEPLLLVRNEQDRFAKERTLKEPTPEASEDLLKIQAHYVKRFAELDLAKAKSIHDLATRYEKSLDRLQASFTKKNLIQDALKVKEVRDALAQREDVREAAALVAANLEKPKETPETKLASTHSKTAPQTVANKFKGSDKKRIGHRYQDFLKSLDKQDVKMLTSLFDPALVEKAGTDALKRLFMPYTPMIKAAKAMGANFMTGKIKFSEDELSATQIPYMDGPGEGKDGDPLHWRKIDGEWYLDLGKKKKK